MTAGGAAASDPTGLARRAATVAALFAVSLAVARLPDAGVDAALALAAAIAILLYPPLGLALTALCVPLGSLRAMPIGAGALTATPIVLGWTAFAWLVSRLRRRDAPAWGRPRRPVRVALLALAAYVLVLCASAWRAPDLPRAAFEIARWLELGLALALTADAARSRNGRAVVLLGVLLAGAAAAVLGIRPSLAMSGPEAFAVIGGRFVRASGTFGQPNPFGAFMNMVWPVSLALVALPVVALVTADGRGWRRPPAEAAPSVGWPVLGAAVAALCLYGLGLSWSRGAWLGAAAAAAVMAVLWLIGTLRAPWARHRLALTWLACTAVVALLALGGAGRLPSAVAARLGSIAETFAVWDVGDAEVDDDNFATIERVAHWQAAAAMWSERPWLGQGPGHYEVAYARFRLPRWPDALGHAHNYYLHALAETGLLGLGAYAMFLAALVALLAREAARSVRPFGAVLALGTTGVLVAVAVHSLVDNVFVHDMAVFLGLVTGLALATGDA